MEIVKYIRNRDNQKVGVLVSNGYNSVGWSLCHIGLERFNKERGIEIARGREARGTETMMPVSIAEDYAEFLERSRRYFDKDGSGAL